MTTLEDQDKEIELLKTALRDTAGDLRRYRIIVDDLTCCLKMADLVIEAAEKTAKAQEEELIILRAIGGN